MAENLTYKDAGVDTKEGERAVGLMAEHVKRTFAGGAGSVLAGLGGFGSLYRPDLSGMEEPVLVAGTDGVGTKLMVAFLMDRHDTIGQDCVAMCVNDVLCQGAAPLFFLDYIAAGRVSAEKIEQIVKGVADGCVLAECALVGGETAEMPGLYGEDEYDLAGFCVGLVDRSRIIDGRDVRAGDVIVGIPSSGLHSNGYSLARKVLFEHAGLSVGDPLPGAGAKGLAGEGNSGSAGHLAGGGDSGDSGSANERPTESVLTVGEALLTPTRIYTKQVKALLAGAYSTGAEMRDQDPVSSPRPPKALIHITGGGFYENIPRVIPQGLGVRIRKGAWTPPPIFAVIAAAGGIEEHEMFSTFNMGIGMMAVVAPEEAERALAALRGVGEDAFLIGEVVVGKGVEIA